MSDQRGLTLERLKDHLHRVLEYCWRDELEDYADHLDEGGVGEALHIFHDLVALDGFLSGHRKTARDFVRESLAPLVSEE